MKIYTVDEDPRLRERSRELTAEELSDPKMQKLIDDMIPKMFEADGIGLAAPQIGEGIRVIVIGLFEEQPMVLINPEITFFSKKTQVMDEGCLSVPDFVGPVRRPEKIRFKALDREGNSVNMKVKGMMARVVQHEVDHLDGILFIDRVKEQGGTLAESTASSVF